MISALVTKFPPFDVPHAPLRGAPHEAFVPPNALPVQVHVHALGFVPDTVAGEAVYPQSDADGAVAVPTLFAVPQAPSIRLFALHDAVTPPFDPAQVHVHGPEPLIPLEAPTLHWLVIPPEV